MAAADMERSFGSTIEPLLNKLYITLQGGKDPNADAHKEFDMTHVDVQVGS